LQFQEIERIQRFAGQYLRVVGQRKYHVIGIPEAIENFPEILQSMAALMPLTETRRDIGVRAIVITAFAFGLWIVMLWSTSLRIVLVLGGLLGGFLVWLFVFIQRNPNISRRSKRFGWLYLFVLFLVGLKVFEAIGRTLKH
jgi:hypothetical protein